ncbi:MAG: aminopeptidase [Fibrella sp.]|nr:aminopeptidase [Armatimonadota bacterium]
MKDTRFNTLARLLVSHSMDVQPGEKVLIENTDVPAEFTVALIDAIAEAGGLPLVITHQQQVLRALIKNATEEQMKTIGDIETVRMEAVQCYVAVRGTYNSSEYSDLPGDKMATYEKQWWHRVHSQIRVPKTKWVVLRWPHPSMAQSAGMSTEAFEDFYFRVCGGVDYKQMERAVEPLKQLMEATDRVRITGPGTDLSFSIKGIGAIPCTGHRNIPDGECFTAPVRDSINGTLQYNCDTVYRGTVFSGVRFRFENGKIVEADAGGNTAKLNEILDSDEGARYIGEWSLGFNPFVTIPMRDTLFDEKIAGSFHMTPGNAYDIADNGNKSQIHWDMVCLQDAKSGGGKIYFDDVLIREDGIFTLPELQSLNPESFGA